MRVSTRVMYGGLSNRLGKQASGLMDAQRRIATGQRVQRPSDDPAGAGRATVLDSRLADVAQYQSNAAAAKANLSAAENAIATVVNSFREARRIAVAGANDTMGESERRLMASQVDRIIEQVRQTAETRYGGRYLFSGTATLTPPLALTTNDASPFTYAGNDGQRIIEIGDGVTVRMNVTARNVFNFDGTGVATAPDAFTALATIRDSLNKGDTETLSNCLDDLDQLLENFNKHRAEIGQMVRRIEFNDQHLAEQHEVITGLRADVVEMDFAAAITDYTTRQVVYEATIALASRIDQPGLFEFLRG